MAGSDSLSFPAAEGGPFESRAFRILWPAMVGVNVGVIAHEIAAAWLVAATGRESLVAMVPASGSIPFILLAIPAGVIADTLDRRRLAAGISAWLAIVSLALAASVLGGWAGPGLVIVLTAAIGSGSALFMPLWQALTPDLVQRPSLPQAFALNSLGINIARSLGPLVAGAALAGAGQAAPFAINAVLFGIVAACFLVMSDKAPVRNTTTASHFMPALVEGFRYVRYASDLQRVLLLTLSFFPFAGVFWALMAVVVRERLEGTGLLLGFMVASFGIGALIGAMLLPRLRKFTRLERLIFWASVASAAVLPAVPTMRSGFGLSPLIAILGFSWITAFSSVHLLAQSRLPAWVRGRATSYYMLTIFSGLAVGSALWGQLAERVSLEAAFAVAGVLLLIAGLVARFGVPAIGAPAAPGRFRHLATASASAMSAGPFAVELAYGSGAPAEADLHALEGARKRAGAIDWRWTVTPGGATERILFPDMPSAEAAVGRATDQDEALEQRVLSASALPDL